MVCADTAFQARPMVWQTAYPGCTTVMFAVLCTNKSKGAVIARRHLLRHASMTCQMQQHKHSSLHWSKLLLVMW